MTHGRLRLYPGWLAQTALALSLALGFYALSRLGAAAAIYLPFSHIDGAFQTASGLFRLQDGQLPGRDFFPYLGVGVVSSIYPLFLAFGGDFAATLAASHLMVAASQACGFAVILYLCCGGRQLLLALVLAVLACAAVLLWDTPPALIAERLSPGNSLRPLRSALPYLAALVVYRSFLQRDLAAVGALGMSAGLAMLWSNDFALPTALGCGLASAYCLMARRHLHHWVKGSAGFLLGFAFGLLPLLLITGGQLPALLAFNFIDVAGDQWWYFGPWSETDRIYGLADLRGLLTPATGLALAVLCAVLTLAWRARDLGLWALAWLGLILLLGGVLASVGGHLGGYFPPFHFWALLASIGLAVGWAARQLPRANAPATGVAAALGLLALALLVAAGARSHQLQIERQASRDEAHLLIPELGGYLHRSWAPYAEFIRQTDPSDSVLEEYWGIWSAMRRPTPLLPVDSAIHALGRLRDDATHVMEDHPARVVTSFPHGWQTWSLTANYWLQRVLLEHYEPVFASPATIVWERAERELTWRKLPCSVTHEGSAVTVEARQRGYYELTLEHDAIPGGRRIALLHSGVSDPHYGWAALPPAAGQTQLPAFAPEPGPVTHGSLVLPRREDASLRLRRCQAREMPIQDPRLFANAPAVYPLTDTTWDAGFHRTEPMLLALDTLDHRARLVPGTRLQLSDGTALKVTSVDLRPPWLQVRFAGAAIDISRLEKPIAFTLTAPDSVSPIRPASPGEVKLF